MFNDLRFALRMIRTHAWFSAAVIVTLALGIGINTTVFTLVNAALFKPVPIPGGERLVTVLNRNPTRPDDRSPISYPDFREYQAQNHVFAALEASAPGAAVLSEAGNPPMRYSMARVTSGLFTMLRTPPAAGRGLSPADNRVGAEPVALIGYTVWQSRYGGAGDVVGRVVRINGTPTTIIGVMPEGFRFPQNEDVWLPLVPTSELQQRSNRTLMAYAMLKDGTSLETANRDCRAIGARLAKTYSDTDRELEPVVQTFQETFNGGRIKTIFLLMLGSVVFVLLIACANVANMLLSRAIGRARELSIRAAMGASRAQLVRQLLVESVLLSCLGGLVGLGLCAFGVHAFDLATRDVGKPYWVQFDLDWRVWGYFAAVSVTTGLVFGLVPALRAARVDLNSALKDGAPGSGNFRGGRLTAGLVVLQFALTAVLLASAGLLMRSFVAAQRMNPFVPSEKLLTARLQVPEAKGERYADIAKRAQLMQALIPKLQALPGVTHAASGSFLPGLGANSREVEIEGRPKPRQPEHAGQIVVTADYLPTVGLPLIRGRGFDELDGAPGHEAMIVTNEFARKYWPNESPLGKRLRFIEDGKPTAWAAVIGVTADIAQNPNEKNAPPVVYEPHRQEAWGWMALVIRTRGDPTALTKQVREIVQSLDPDLPLSDVATLSGTLEHQNWYLRVFGTLFGVFAAAALTMASVGIYAVVAQATVRRTREIGIRMALGATAARILRLVLARGVAQLAVGIGLGLAGAFGVTQILGSTGVLGPVSPHDPFVFGAIVLLLVVIGTFACWLPARRAAALHPVTALRYE